MGQRVLDLLKADTQAALGFLLDSTTETKVHLLLQIISRLQQPVYLEKRIGRSIETEKQDDWQYI